jgi:hypothetical protein
VDTLPGTAGGIDALCGVESVLLMRSHRKKTLVVSEEDMNARTRRSLPAYCLCCFVTTDELEVSCPLLTLLAARLVSRVQPLFGFQTGLLVAVPVDVDLIKVLIKSI